MILAISIAALVVVGAIFPTTQALVAYQKTETDLREITLHGMAALRIEQVGSAIWRDAAPPIGHGPLLDARVDALEVDSWGVGVSGLTLQQNPNAAGWAPLAAPVQALQFQYLLNDGSWQGQALGADADAVISLRFTWNEADHGRTYGGWAIPTDRQFSGGLIELPQPDLSTPYDRSDYEMTFTLPLGSWP
jgi:hypothetical protein